MSQAINKCAMPLNDSEVFSEPKHADIKILEKAQKNESTLAKRNRPCLVLAGDDETSQNLDRSRFCIALHSQRRNS